MSFLYKTTPVLKTATRSSTRLFSTTIAQRKVIPDAVKEPIKKVDRTVSDQLVKGLDAAESAKNTAAQTVGVGSSEAKAKANEVAGQASGKASELKGEAKGKAAEVEGKVKSSV